MTINNRRSLTQGHAPETHCHKTLSLCRLCRFFDTNWRHGCFRDTNSFLLLTFTV